MLEFINKWALIRSYLGIIFLMTLIFNRSVIWPYIGVAYCIVNLMLIIGLLRKTPYINRPADLVTLIRAAISMGLFVYYLFNVEHTLINFMLATLCLILDRLDGYLASIVPSNSYGHIFDMEIDALFILFLCVILFRINGVGPWILIPGTLRPIYVVLSSFIIIYWI